MIPKIIHSILDWTQKSSFQFNEYLEAYESDWDYMFWDETTLAHYFPTGLQNQKQFDEMQELCGKCDIARYEILNKFGGFFIDAGSICIDRIDYFMLNNDSFSCYENEFERGQFSSR